MEGARMSDQSGGRLTDSRRATTEATLTWRTGDDTRQSRCGTWSHPNEPSTDNMRMFALMSLHSESSLLNHLRPKLAMDRHDSQQGVLEVAVALHDEAVLLPALHRGPHTQRH